MASPVSAMFVSDLHFSEDPPPYRRGEVNWIDTQEGYVEQLRQLSIDVNCNNIFIAGDIFDRWNPSPHIINHVIKWFSNFVNAIYAIPGNHDLPNHNYKELPRSAYWTLVEAGKLFNLTPGINYERDDLIVTPFPWDFEVVRPKIKHDLCLNVALIHSFIWVKDYGHVNAGEESRYAKWAKDLEGYDAAFFGDNHKSFLVNPKDYKKCKILNCGTFMKRRSDEDQLRPCVGLLHSNGTITRHYLDTSKDIYSPTDTGINELSSTLQADLAEFTSELDKIYGEKINFAKSVRLWCDKNNVSDSIKKILFKSLEISNANKPY